MQYIKFAKEQIKTTEHNKLQNKPTVYYGEFPDYIKKTEYIEKEKIKSDETNRDEITVRTTGTNRATKILYGILAVILFFSGIYLSGIKCPDYIYKPMMQLVQTRKNNHEKQTLNEENTKIIGGKVFVDNIKEEKSAKTGDDEYENSRFAQTIRLQSQKENEVSNQQKENGQNEKAVQVIAKNMSKGSDRIYCTNRTDLEIDINSYLGRKYPIERIIPSQTYSDPKVLIIHTHGTEAYIDTGENGITRSKNTEKNIVRAGEELANVLKAYGIPVIHSKTMHDEISYVKAYENSKKEAKEYLEKYPTIEYIIDVHRDAIGTEENPVKTETEINSRKTAQLMFVMGTNASGGNHPDFEKNLTVAANIQQKANKLFPELMRPVNIRPIIFNQNLTDGCMILEVGSDANTLEEALEAVRMFGRCFAEVVSEERD